MHIERKRSWQLPDSAVTPETVYLGRRRFLGACALGLMAGALLPRLVRAATSGFPDSLDQAYQLSGVKLTSYNDITGYNNFYEWGWRNVSLIDQSLSSNLHWTCPSCFIDRNEEVYIRAVDRRG